MPEDFEARLNQFTDLTSEDLMAILKASAQDVLSAAQATVANGGDMPVVTGFLRNSLKSQIAGSSALTGANSYVAVLVGWEPGETFESGWTAKYAARIEFGYTGPDKLGRKFKPNPRYYLRNQLAKWPQFVYANAVSLTRTT